LLSALGLMALPFIIVVVLVKLLPPWAGGKASENPVG